MRRLLLIFYTAIFSFFLGTASSFSQSFDWCKDGYSPLLENYTNIDGSGINLTIKGLTYRNPCYFDEPYVYLGINNGGAQGIVHNYNFSFSENVDVEFMLFDINADTIGRGGFRYNDFLIFSPSPTFSNTSPSLTIKGDTVLPDYSTPNGNGEMKVKFKNVNSFSIRHGSGKGPNPGSLTMASLIINDDKLSAPQIFNKLADQEIAIFKRNSTIRSAHLITTTGQLLTPRFQTDDSGLTRIETLSLAAGIYFLMVEFNSGHVLKEKILVHR